VAKCITQIGRYEISRQVVDSALASIYDGFDPVERRAVTIRVPRATQSGNSQSGASDHPGLMKILGYEENQGAPFLVLEPFAGKPLESLLVEGKLANAEALKILRQLANTLDYAHAHGSIHGSLHPANVLVNERLEVKIPDLGAAPAEVDTSVEQLRRAVDYLSPERIRDTPMDGRSDQFSLAVLAHRLLTGALPFAADSAIAVMFRIVSPGVERSSMRHLPAEAQSALVRALASQPEGRYASCGELAGALEAALPARPAMAPTRIAESPTPVPRLPDLPPPARAQSAVLEEISWKDRYLNRVALKYFGLAFAVSVVIFGLVAFWLMPKPSPRKAAKPPETAPAAALPPVVEAPVKPKAAPVRRPRPVAKKEPEPELKVRPAEPKIGP
jgi:serine/threonine protein kinase